MNNRLLGGRVDDVVDGIVSLDAAERSYGVVIRCLAIDDIVKLPEDYVIDEAATRTLRAKMSTG